MSASEMLIAALMGALGGVLLEAAEVGRHIRRYGHVPWSRSASKPRAVVRDGVVRRYETVWVYLATIGLRAFVGAGVAFALASTGPLSPLAAAIVGAGAYGIVDRWAMGTTVAGGIPDPWLGHDTGPAGQLTGQGEL